MILLKDVRDFVATLGIAANDHCYSGAMDAKKDCSIGAYNMKSQRARNVIGGRENSSYDTKAISFLVHWNKSQPQTEAIAVRFNDALENTRDVVINGHTISFIDVTYSEPIPVGKDDNGIYEYVIECLIYTKKESE